MEFSYRTLRLCRGVGKQQKTWNIQRTVTLPGLTGPGDYFFLGGASAFRYIQLNVTTLTRIGPWDSKLEFCSVRRPDPISAVEAATYGVVIFIMLRGPILGMYSRRFRILTFYLIWRPIRAPRRSFPLGKPVWCVRFHLS